jgi:ATP-dependent exoDNAse (exonuclease V) beta subunit
MIQPTTTRYPNTLIRASAGTGKTFQLSNRFLALLDHDAPLDQILATTFTRKAAGEILDRILLRLADAALDLQACEELGSHLHDPELTRTRCRRMLAAATRNLHRLRVSTLDAFFAKIASSFSLELGLPPGWRIVDELQDAQMRAEAIEAVIAQDSAADVLTLMHLLTKGEAKRGIGDLLRDTVNQVYSVFCETTPEAWSSAPRYRYVTDERMAEAISTLRQMEFPSKFQRTACNKDLDAVERGDWEKFIKFGLAAKIASGGTTFQRKEIPECALKEYRALLHHARATLLGHVANQTEAAYKVLKKFHTEYERLKTERRALRFEDITRRLADAAMLEDGQRIAFRLDAAVSHLLLDEFQDTSLHQWCVLRPFARRAASGVGGSSFFCVGDVKQAIYGWRGGVAEIFDALENELERLRRTSLNQSFRSSAPVIETVNRVFTRLLQHSHLEHYEPAVHEWCKQFETHSTSQADLPGHVTLAVSPAPGEDESADDVHDLWCARRIADLVREAPGFTVGVLVRTNIRVGRLIHLLRELGLHASEEGGNPVTDSAAVEAALSLFRLADHPGDTIARFHVANSPFAGEFELRDWRDSGAVARLAQSLRRRLLEHGYGATVDAIARILAPHGSDRDRSRLAQLVELAYRYQEQATLRARDFVRFVEHQKVADPVAADVRVMTVHQAKGLEFDIVVLPELDANLVGQPGWFVVGRPDPTSPVDRVCRYTNQNIQELLPREFQEMFEADIAHSVRESLCVLYVALTRPVHALHMIVKAGPAASKNPAKTFAGLLRASLADGKSLSPETTVYAFGDPKWFHHTAGGRETASEVEAGFAAPAAPLRIELKKTPVRRRHLERKPPSSLEGGKRIKLSDVFGRENMAAIQRGLVMHAWLAQIEWLDPKSPGGGIPHDDALRRIGNEAAETAIDLDPLIAEFRGMLDKPAVAAAMRRETYRNSPEQLGMAADVLAEIQSAALRLTVQNERRFAVREGDAVVLGHVDRLVLLHDGAKLVAADVIDFKTDVLPSKKSFKDRVAFYRPQLEAYRRSLAKTLRLTPDRIAARMLFLDAGTSILVE